MSIRFHCIEKGNIQSETAHAAFCRESRVFSDLLGQFTDLRFLHLLRVSTRSLEGERRRNDASDCSTACVSCRSGPLPATL